MNRISISIEKYLDKVFKTVKMQKFCAIKFLITCSNLSSCVLSALCPIFWLQKSTPSQIRFKTEKKLLYNINQIRRFCARCNITLTESVYDKKITELLLVLVFIFHFPHLRF